MLLIRFRNRLKTMKKIVNILSLIAMLIGMVTIAVSCANDEDQTTAKVQIGVASNWQQGRISSRALTDQAAPENNVITKVIVNATPKEEGMTAQTICVDVNSPSDPVDGYQKYNTSDGGEFGSKVTLDNIDKYNYIGRAVSPVDESWLNAESMDIPAFGTKDYLVAKDENVTIQKPYVCFRLQHQTALIRFVLGVNETYNKLRTFKIKSLKVSKGDKAITSKSYSEPKVLTTTGDLILSFNFNPAADFSQTGSNEVVVTATYDVYDKEGQLTRDNCTASNKLTLPLTGTNAIKKGYYYDVKVTLAPDFLYVLSDNDNKSDLVLK